MSDRHRRMDDTVNLPANLMILQQEGVLLYRGMLQVRQEFPQEILKPLKIFGLSLHRLHIEVRNSEGCSSQENHQKHLYQAQQPVEHKLTRLQIDHEADNHL